jgi:isoleucyl-tRNA synthetase
MDNRHRKWGSPLSLHVGKTVNRLMVLEVMSKKILKNGQFIKVADWFKTFSPDLACI